MSIEITTLLFFLTLVFFLVLGLPLAFVLGGVSVLFLYFTWGVDAFYMVASQMWGTMEASPWWPSRCSCSWPCCSNEPGWRATSTA